MFLYFGKKEIAPKSCADHSYPPIMRGDELLSINGQSVTHLPLDEVWRSMSFSAPEQHLALKLRRDGTIYATELKVDDPAAPQQV
jgi:hypothetical protein